MSSTNSDSFTSFPIWVPFISFSSVIAVANTPQIKLHKSLREDIFVLLLILEEMLSVFHCWVWNLLCVSHMWPLFCWGRFSLCHNFYCKWVLSFVKIFFCIYWDNPMILILQLIWCITLINLHMLKNPCIPELKPTWLQCMIHLMCCQIQFASILLRIFASMFISGIGLSFSVFVISLSSFGIIVMVVSENDFGCVLSSAMFWKSLRRIDANSY